MPDFVLDAKIASALNRIIHNSHFKRRVSLEEQKAQKEVLPGHWSQRFRRELCRPVYYCSSKWWCSGIRFKMGRNFIINDENPIWWHLGKIVQIKNTRVWETQDRIGIVQPGDSSEESRSWLLQIEDDGEKKYRARFTKQEFLGPETEIMKETPWSRIRGQNSVDKEFLEIVGNGKPTGSVLKETIAVSVTILLSVQKWHSRIRLRVLSCNRKRETRREPEVPEERVPVVECLDDPARITSKELAPIHSVKNGTLQNACSSRPRVVADLGKSARMRIVRLTNNLVKGPKRMVTKVQWPCWRSMSYTIERGDPLCTTHQIHDNWVAYSRLWSRRSLHRFYGRAQTYGNRSDV